MISQIRYRMLWRLDCESDLALSLRFLDVGCKSSALNVSGVMWTWLSVSCKSYVQSLVAHALISLAEECRYVQHMILMLIVTCDNRVMSIMSWSIGHLGMYLYPSMEILQCNKWTRWDFQLFRPWVLPILTDIMLPFHAPVKAYLLKKRKEMGSNQRGIILNPIVQNDKVGRNAKYTEWHKIYKLITAQK